jgi:hypothetical protein
MTAAGGQAQLLDLDDVWLDGCVENRRHTDGDHGQNQHGGVHAGVFAAEALHAMFQPAQQHAQAQNQQDIAQHRADQRGLDQLHLAGADGDDGDDQLGRVAQGGVEQAAEARPDLFSPVNGER